jgi:hypothetical protein
VSPYRFIEVENVHHAVATLCRVLKVSASPTTSGRDSLPSARQVTDAKVTERIATIPSTPRPTPPMVLRG